MPLCSFLIASRYRFDQLKKLILSIMAASESKSYEIIVRLHSDDDSSWLRVHELPGLVQVFGGANLSGYNSLHAFSAQLMEKARGEWVWFLNDDMLLKGEGWEDQLRAIEGEALVHPETHILNESVYHNDQRGPAPCVRNERKYQQLLLNSLTPDVDYIFYRYFSFHQLPIVFLHGCAVIHEWAGVEAHVL